MIYTTPKMDVLMIETADVILVSGNSNFDPDNPSGGEEERG